MRPCSSAARASRVACCMRPTLKPSWASRTAGARSSLHERLAKRRCSCHRPSTVPGTPAAPAPTVLASAITSPCAIQVHAGRGTGRGALAVVEEVAVALEEHRGKAAAAEVARLRVGHREDEGDRDRRIHRIAPVGQHLGGDIRRSSGPGRRRRSGKCSAGGDRQQRPPRRELEALRSERGTERRARAGRSARPRSARA